MFQSKEELEVAVQDYFDSCMAPRMTEDGSIITDKKGKPIYYPIKPFTITGLAVHLGCCRQTLLNYEGREDFLDTIKAAKLKCHQFTEEYLYSGKTPSGAIFSLKNNYGWVDKTEVATTNTNISAEELKNMTDEDLERIIGGRG